MDDKAELKNIEIELKKLEGSAKGKNIRRATKKELDDLARRLYG